MIVIVARRGQRNVTVLYEEPMPLSAADDGYAPTG
jgi:hypothetical protein